MSRCAIAAALAACPVVLTACASLVGLDQISESACAPNCGADAATGDDSTSPEAETSAPDSRVDEWKDGPADAVHDSQLLESSPSDSQGGDTSSGLDATADTTPARDSSADTSLSHDAAEAGPCGTVYFSDAFDDNSRGWTLDTSWSIASTCASPPAPQKGNPDPTVDHTTGAAGGVAGAFVCGNNPAGTKNTARYVTSPTIDVTSAPAVYLTFYRWLNSDEAAYMTSTVDVYDGTAWVNVYTNPSGSGNLVADAAWTKLQYDVTAQKNAAFRVRFGYAVLSTSGYSMSCWNVDDITVSSVACP
jgi:hypothetical protein